MATLNGSIPAELPGIGSTSGLDHWASWAGSVPLPLGGASSFNLPQITNVSPPIGSTLAAKNTPIEFDVIDVDSSIASVAVWTRIQSPIVGEFTVLIYDGASFVWPFELSAIAAIDDGYHFTLRYKGNWPGNIVGMVARAVSSHGEVAL